MTDKFAALRDWAKNGTMRPEKREVLMYALAEIERLRAIVEHAAGSHHCDRAVDALEGKP